MASLKSTIVAAYTHLVRTKRTAFPAISDVLNEAGIARSTLYKHFDDRSAMLVESMRGPFSVLAAAAQTGEVTPGLIALLEHFWAERRGAADLLASSSVDRLAKGLSAELGLRIRDLDRPGALRIAQSQISFLRLWVTGETPCSPVDMAAILARSSSALVAASGCGPYPQPNVENI
ncbi:MAG: hypothetical protein QM698_00670 [Micropepsaceae bacterium]